MKIHFLQDYTQLRPLWMAIFTDMLGMAIILPFLPVLVEQYNINFLLLGFLISSNPIFGFIFSPIFGKLSDKYGRRPMILIAQFGTLVGFIILSCSNTLILIFLARIIDGIFNGQYTISQAVVGDVVPPLDRGKIMTTLGSAYTFAFIFGPIIGGLLFQNYGLLGLGLLATFIAAFNLLLTYCLVNETHPNKTHIKSAWMFQLNSSTSSQLSTKKLALTSSSIWNNHQATYILALYSILVLFMSTLDTTFNLFGFQYLHLNPTELGLVYTAMATFQVIIRLFLFNTIHQKLGDTKSAIGGIFIYLSAFILMSVLTSFWTTFVIMLYITMGAIFSRGILMGFVSRSADANNQGKIMGVVSRLDNFGQIIGPFIGTYLLIEQSGLMYLITLGIMSLVAFIMSFRLIGYGFDKVSLSDPRMT